MPITFEECCFCGKYEMRKEGLLVYNQSLNIFYYAWVCYNCNGFVYEEVEFKDMKNAESKKAMCLMIHNWNEKAVIHNRKNFNY